jgi:hypothetical protein
VGVDVMVKKIGAAEQQQMTTRQKLKIAARMDVR